MQMKTGIGHYEELEMEYHRSDGSSVVPYTICCKHFVFKKLERKWRNRILERKWRNLK